MFCRVIGCAAFCGALAWPVAAGAEPLPALDTVILTPDEVQAVVGHPFLDTSYSRNSPSAPSRNDLPPQCRAAFDPSAGGEPVDYRAVGYFWYSNRGISQSIARYSDAATAASVFATKGDNLTTCEPVYPYAPGLSYTLTRPDPVTLLLQYPGTVNGPGSAAVYRLDGPMIIEVGADHYSTDPRQAYAVLDRIEDRVHAG